MHLRDADLGRYLRLRHAAQEPEDDDPPLALVERVQPLPNDGAALERRIAPLLVRQSREVRWLVVVMGLVERAWGVGLRGLEGPSSADSSSRVRERRIDSSFSRRGT